ncbi:MAG: GYD domain-containing protein [Gammaproteobacteria bacterium]|nr:MAG: GYD domain-containing protein [Gammaproteobacteria bacterium]TDJ33569.1 MAG: GYD domain-containing protein [Gammaproteobacteria bacterium]
MATYIMLSTLTDEGRKTLKERPERLKAVNKEVEAMGARVVSQYAVLGGYDFVNIIEAPSNEVMSRVSIELGARGTIKVTTFPAMSIDAFIEMLEGTSTSGK